MRKNKIISLFAIVAVMFIMLTACGSDPIADDIKNYVNNQMPAVTKLQNSVIDEYNSVVADKYVDDKTLLTKLKGEVIPNSNKLIENAKAVTTKAKELGTLHDQYIAAMTKQNSGFIMLQTALEKDDGDMATKADNILKEAYTQFQKYQTDLNALAKEHGGEIKY